MQIKVVAKNGNQTVTYEYKSEVVPRVKEKLWLGDHQFEVVDVTYYVAEETLQHVVVHVKYKDSPEGTFETFKYWAKKLNG